MNSAGILKRISRTTWRERRVLAEAVLQLAFASLAIRLLPFRTVVGALASADRPERDPAGRARRRAEIVWAVRAAAPFLPWRIVCFQKGLALHRMLRRRGIPSLLHYGVARKDGPEGLGAHVWISSEGEVLIGGREAVGYACLATFPPAALGQ